MPVTTLALALCLNLAPASPRLLPELTSATPPAASLQLLDEQIRLAPTGWPTGTIVGAAVGFGLAAILTGTGLYFIYGLESGVGTAAILGLGMLGFAGAALILGVVCTVLGVVTATVRAQRLTDLRDQRRSLESVRAPVSAWRAPEPGMTLARF